VRGEQSHDESVLTAITVRGFFPSLKMASSSLCQALNIVIRMEPSLRYPSSKNSFFTDQIEEARPIGGGIVLWRGYFQSLRPAIDRILINVDTATGVMYRPGRLIDLALDVLGRSTPNALASQHGLPERERMKLQQFISGMKITTPYRAQDPERRRLVRKVTRRVPEIAHSILERDKP
jgi:eukaryotic translation initiation factor 2C